LVNSHISLMGALGDAHNLYYGGHITLNLSLAILHITKENAIQFWNQLPMHILVLQKHTCILVFM